MDKPIHHFRLFFGFVALFGHRKVDNRQLTVDNRIERNDCFAA